MENLTVKEIFWEAPEYEHHPKSILWFWSSIFLALLLLAVAIWQKNFLFGVFIVIAEILILIWGAKNPEILQFKITDEGLHLGKYNFYSISDIANFSITESIWPGFLVLKINIKKRLRPHLLILVPKEKIEIIRNLFSKKNIPEVEYEEHFLDSLQKLLKF